MATFDESGSEKRICFHDKDFNVAFLAEPFYEGSANSRLNVRNHPPDDAPAAQRQ